MATELRMTPRGEMIEVIVPDPQNVPVADRPMLAVDMFGQINTGNPLIEKARTEAAYRHDVAEANESARARFEKPRWFDPRYFKEVADENPDTAEAIDREIFKPVRLKWGIPDPESTNPNRLFEMGNTLVQANPHNGSSRVVYTAPPKPVDEKDREFITGKDIYGREAKTKMKPSAFAAALPSFPDFVRTNAFNLAQMGTNSPSFQPPSAVTSSARRLRVKGPGNQKGSVLEGTALPAGWSYE